MIHNYSSAVLNRLIDIGRLFVLIDAIIGTRRLKQIVVQLFKWNFSNKAGRLCQKLKEVGWYLSIMINWWNKYSDWLFDWCWKLTCVYEVIYWYICKAQAGNVFLRRTCFIIKKYNVFYEENSIKCLINNLVRLTGFIFLNGN